jgi:hypothetical protein
MKKTQNRPLMIIALLYITPTQFFFSVVSLGVLCFGAYIGIKIIARFPGIKIDTLLSSNHIPIMATQFPVLVKLTNMPGLFVHREKKPLSGGIAIPLGCFTINNYPYGCGNRSEHNYYTAKKPAM